MHRSFSNKTPNFEDFTLISSTHWTNYAVRKASSFWENQHYFFLNRIKKMKIIAYRKCDKS